MTLPTPYELATLAAAIPIQRAFKYDGGMPNQTFKDELDYRAHHAYDLWRICEQVIENAPNMVEMMAKKAASIREADFSRVPLDEFLRQLMPSTKPDDQMKWWRDYRATSLNGDKQVTEDRTEGIERAGIKTVMEHFRAWKEKEQRKRAREKQSKGGKTTSEKRAEKRAAEEKKLEVEIAEARAILFGRGTKNPQLAKKLKEMERAAEDYKEARLMREAKEKNKKLTPLQELNRVIQMALEQSSTEPANENLPPKIEKSANKAD